MGERDHHYETNWEFGIAVGSSQGSNRATLVYMPGKGTRAWERLDVRALKMQRTARCSHRITETRSGASYRRKLQIYQIPVISSYNQPLHATG